MAEDIKSWDDFLRLVKEGTFSPKEVAHRLDCSVSYVYKLIYEGKLTAYTLGRRKIILKRDLDEFVRRYLKEGVG